MAQKNNSDKTIMGKYIHDDKVQELIHYLESVKEFDRYYISSSLNFNDRDFNIKYFNNSFSKEERVSIYKFINEYFYNNSLKIE